MKENTFLRRCAIKLKAGFRFKTNTYAFLLFAAMGFTSCNEHNSCEDPEPMQRCPDNWCNTFATVVEDGCRDGALGTKWLRLDNGDLLWPQDIVVAVPTLQDGQRVSLGYNVLQTEPSFTSRCQNIMAPEAADFAIQITCIQSVSFCGTGAGNCDTYATATNAMCGMGVWGNIWLKLDDGTYLQPFENTVAGASLVEGQRYKIGYERMTRDSRYDGQAVCLAMPPAAEAVRITCLTSEGLATTSSK